MIRLILIMRRWLLPLLAAAVVAATVLGVEPAGALRSKVSVAASFYPVAFAAQRVGGSRVDVANLTPIGANMFLRVPMDALANRVVSLDDIFSAGARTLTSRLHDAPDWQRCFDILDDSIAARIAATRPPAEGP